MKLYKYQKINKFSISGLQQKKLWMADPRTFNDAYELKVMDIVELDFAKIRNFQSLITAAKKIRTDLIGRSDAELAVWLSKELQNVLHNNVGVICYTESNDNKLMWAHYADSNKGICLGFEIPDSEVAKKFTKVKYEDCDPITQWKRLTESEDGFFKILVVKGLDWSYEEEWRQIFVNQTAFLSNYPGELTDVILGANISTKHINQIKTIYQHQPGLIKHASVDPSRNRIVVN